MTAGAAPSAAPTAKTQREPTRCSMIHLAKEESVMSVPTIPPPTTALPAALPSTARPVTFPVLRRGRLTVLCQEWCTTDHQAEAKTGMFPEDVVHSSAPVALTLPVWGGGTEEILRAQIDQWPLDDEDRTPVATVWPAPEGEPMSGLTPAGLDEVIGRLLGHVECLRALRDELAQARSVHEARFAHPSPRG